MWLYIRAIFVATPTGEVSEVENFVRFDGVPEPALSSVFARTCSQPSVFFRVHPLSVRGLTFTCMRGSVIFSNMLDFAVCVWTTCIACLLAAFGSSTSLCYHSIHLALTSRRRCSVTSTFNLAYRPVGLEEKRKPELYYVVFHDSPFVERRSYFGRWDYR